MGKAYQSISKHIFDKSEYATGLCSMLGPSWTFLCFAARFCNLLLEEIDHAQQTAREAKSGQGGLELQGLQG